MAVAVAAPHPAAVEAARAVVGDGGNALDAALAAAAALTVAYPHQCSIGGDLVAIVRPAGGQPRAVVSAGAAAAAVDVGALRAAGDRMPRSGPQTVTVPGVVAGWAAIAGLGARLPLSTLLAPAIKLAADGVPISPGLRRIIDERIDTVRADPGLSALLLKGDVLHQPELASTLTAVAANWRTFYQGHLAHRLVEALRAMGSALDISDFAAHRAEVGSPLTAVVDGVTWHAAPPPAQGPIFLAVVGSDDLLASSRRARQARDTLLGDPRTGPVAWDALVARSSNISDLTAATDFSDLSGRESISGAAASSDISEISGISKPAGDTVAVTAVDSDGTAVTLIQSVFDSFGAGLLDPGTGILLHSRGSAFSLDPAHPGRIAPGARPPHTLCPTLALGAGTVLALGCQGGYNQPWILAQVADSAVATPDLDALLARPRWIFEGRSVVAEPGTPGLEGIDATVTAGPHDDAGHVQACRLRGGALAAASDPRADGLGAVLG